MLAVGLLPKFVVLLDATEGLLRTCASADESTIVIRCGNPCGTVSRKTLEPGCVKVSFLLDGTARMLATSPSRRELTSSIVTSAPGCTSAQPDRSSVTALSLAEVLVAYA